MRFDGRKASKHVRMFYAYLLLGLVLTGVSNLQERIVALDIPVDYEEKFNEDVSEVTLDIVRSQLRHFHEQHIHLLDVSCFAADCPFSRARQIIGNVAETTKYWNYLNCIKYGETCPVAGGWSHWSKYSPCSARCGTGYSFYLRNCTLPNPLYGGPRCKGSNHKLRRCTADQSFNCMFDPSLIGIWGQWSKWSQCDNMTSQGTFVRRRARQCLPSLKVEDCEAFGEESFKCRLAPININGGWSNWLLWSDCSTKYVCGHGVRIRKRACSNPYRRGDGADCPGASSETMQCEGPKCVHETQEIAHLLPHSFLRYSTMPPSYFLSVYFKFFPTSNGGTLFQYSNQAALQEATKSGNVIIKKPSLDQLVNADSKEDANDEVKVDADVNPFVDESYVIATLDSPIEILIQLRQNGSQEIRIPLRGVRLSKWNELRILVVSNKVVCRLNDRENVESIMEDISGEEAANTLAVETVDGSVNNVFFNLFGSRKREIFSYFEGEIGVGYVRNGLPGFRGYIAKLSVNYKEFTLKETPRSQIRKYWDPFQVHGLSYSSGNLARTSTFPYFNGRESAKLLLMSSWVKESLFIPEFAPMGSDITTFEFIIIPECKNGLFFYLESEKNPLTHWKLFVEKHRRVRFVMSYGGKITILTSGDDLYISRWNKVTVQLVTRGLAHLEVNKHSYTTSLPNAELEHTPKRFAHVGGFGKSIEHDSLLGADPSDKLRAQFKSFVGYIYSVKVNDRRFYMKDVRRMNNFHMISLDLTVAVKSLHEILFLPTSSDEKVDESADELIPPNSHHQRYRSITCHIPKAEGVFSKPSVQWYFNDKRVENSDTHWTSEQYSNSSHSSNLYFGSAVDSSATHSGVYSCAVTYFGHFHLIAIFVVAVLPEEISHADDGNWYIWNVSKDTVILIISVIAVCALITVLLLLGLIKTIYRKIKRTITKHGDEAESVPLAKIKKYDKPSRHNSHDRKMFPSGRQTMNFETAAAVAMYAGRLREVLLNTSFDDSEDNSSDTSNTEEFKMAHRNRPRRSASAGSTNFETTPLIK